MAGPELELVNRRNESHLTFAGSAFSSWQCKLHRVANPSPGFKTGLIQHLNLVFKSRSYCDCSVLGVNCYFSKEGIHGLSYPLHRNRTKAKPYILGPSGISCRSFEKQYARILAASSSLAKDTPSLMSSIEKGLEAPATSTSIAAKMDCLDVVVCEEPRAEHEAAMQLDNDTCPLKYSKRKKWTITAVACVFTLLVSAATTSYTMGYQSMMKDLNCTSSQAVIGLTTYVVAFGVTPLFTSAFSEEFGRQPMYWVSVIVFLAMYVMVALAPNIAVVAVARVIQGAAGSTGSTMVAGTIADIWEAKDRGIPMAIYSITAFGGTGVGTIAAGWIEANPKLGWKWIQWISLIIAGCYTVVFAFTMRETRASVLRAKMIKKRGLSPSDLGSEETVTGQEKQKFRDLLWVSLTRPLVLLFSEPIVFAISAWLAFAWGIFYCMISSMPSVFRTVHGFSVGQVGTVNVTMVIAVIIGFFTTILQERIYKKKIGKRSVEARLYLCCVAGIAFPASMFMIAWFCQPQIHWALLCFALTIYYWSTFTIYLAVFTYLADCYTIYASSALAGQSLLRNVLGGVFPLFTLKVSDKLGFTWANTLYACLAVLSAPVPITVFFLGSRIRQRSERCIHD